MSYLQQENILWQIINKEKISIEKTTEKLKQLKEAEVLCLKEIGLVKKEIIQLSLDRVLPDKKNDVLENLRKKQFQINNKIERLEKLLKFKKKRLNTYTVQLHHLLTIQKLDLNHTKNLQSQLKKVCADTQITKHQAKRVQSGLKRFLGNNLQKSDVPNSTQSLTYAYGSNAKISFGKESSPIVDTHPRKKRHLPTKADK